MQYVNTSNGKTYTVEDWYLDACKLGVIAHDPNVATQKFEGIFMGCVDHIKGKVKQYSSLHSFLDAHSYTQEANMWYLDAVNSIPLDASSCTIFEVPDYTASYVVACDSETCYCLEYEEDPEVVYNLAEGYGTDEMKKGTACPELAKYLISLMN
jgi:hypothetical protein